MSRPISLSIAVFLQWVAAIVAIFSGFELILSASAMSDAGTAEQIDATLVSKGVIDVSGQFVVVGVFIAGVMLLAVALVRVIASVYLAKGQRWARILIAAFVGVNMVGGFAYLFQGYVLRASLVVAIDLVVLWLLFNAQSTYYIRERSDA